MGRLEKLNQIRSSKNFVVAIVFMIMVIDSLMTSTMVPILPDMIARFRMQPSNELNQPLTGISVQQTRRPYMGTTIQFNLHTQTTSSIPHGETGNSTWNSTMLLRREDSTTVTITGNRSTMSSREEEWRQSDVNRFNNVQYLGVAYAVKPAVEVVFKIAGGVMVDRLGNRMPLLIGFILTLTSLVVFAWANSLSVVILGQVIAGIGCAFSIVSGLALLASSIHNDEERGKALGVVYGGLAVGNTVSFPIATTTYEFLGQPAPFLIMMVLTIFDGGLRLLLKVPQEKMQGFQFFTIRGLLDLLRDVFIWICIGYCFLCYGLLTLLGTINPTWMSITFQADVWQIGVIYCVGAVVQFIAQYITGLFATKVGRWLTALVAFPIMAVSISTFSACSNIWSVLGPESAYRVGLGVALVSIAPTIAVIGDVRHHAQYGTIYGLTDATYSLATIAGTIGGGQMLQAMSYSSLMWVCAAMLILYCGTCVAFRKLPVTTEYTGELNSLQPDEAP